MTYTQVYENTEENPIEAIYKFPADPYFSVTGMHIKLDDKEIDAVIMEKEEAKEQYDDAVAAGNTAAMINYDENIPDVIELAIGALQPGKSVTIDVKMVAKCDVIKHGFFSFIFPINFIPRFSPSGPVKDAPMTRGTYLSSKFSCDITVESSNVISDLSVSHNMEYVQSEDGKTVTLKLEESKNVKAHDVVVSFSTEQIREPTIVLHSSDKHPDEVAAHISFIPRVSDEHEVEETKEEPDAVVEEPNDDADDPDVASGEFIFILDRSGSMARGRIEVAKEALKLFIQSLPSDCKFNIISFGTKHELMYRQSKKYTKEAINETMIKIDHIAANMGGTVMLKPVEVALKSKTNHKYPKNIFILTDGAINNTEEVVSKIREFNYLARVHTFGIGDGASKYLVKETAKAGLGTSALIRDNDPQIKSKVIQALKIAAKPAFTDIKVDWKGNSGQLKFQAPRSPIFGNIYEEESFDLYAIFKKSDLAAGEVEISYFNTFDQSKGSLSLSIDPSKIIDSGDDDCLFKMAAKECMLYYKRTENEEEKKTSKDEIKKLSLEYFVLSSETAFFGKIKNKEKSDKEMKTIKIPIKKMAQYNYGGAVFRSVPGGGGPMKRSKCKAAARGGERSNMMLKSAAPTLGFKN